LRPKLENPPPPWFWGLTKKPTASFEAKPGEIVATSFEAKLEKTVAAGFEANPLETVATSFEAKPVKTVAAGFEAKPLETVATSFEAQTNEKPSKWFWGQTTHKPSNLVLMLNQETRAPRLDVHGADRTQRHLTSRPPGHRVPDLCDHILIAAHHETSKHNSPNETKVKEKQNETVPDSNSNLAKSMTHHNQTKKLTTWFLTYTSRDKHTCFSTWNR
jgi:hypothetical protein